MDRADLKTSADKTARRQFVLVAMTQIFGLSVWFSTAAVTPGLVRDWGISVPQAAWLSMATQTGFAIGAACASLSGVLDRFKPNQVLGVSALTVAALTGAFALFASTLPVAVTIRFLIGICFAGVYPPGLKLTATWSLENRSMRFGILGGCLTIGSALPYLLNVFHVFEWRLLVGATGLACAMAGIVSCTWIRTGPFDENARNAAVDVHYAWRMFKEDGPRSACLGYFGHMFELYAVWTWLPIFLMYSLDQNSITPSLAIAIFGCVGVGGFIGCVTGGWMAQKKWASEE
jgi:MFS family permease